LDRVGAVIRGVKEPAGMVTVEVAEVRVEYPKVPRRRTTAIRTLITAPIRWCFLTEVILSLQFFRSYRVLSILFAFVLFWTAKGALQSAAGALAAEGLNSKQVEL